MIYDDKCFHSWIVQFDRFSIFPTFKICPCFIFIFYKKKLKSRNAFNSKVSGRRLSIFPIIWLAAEDDICLDLFPIDMNGSVRKCFTSVHVTLYAYACMAFALWPVRRAARTWTHLKWIFFLVYDGMCFECSPFLQLGRALQHACSPVYFNFYLFLFIKMTIDVFVSFALAEYFKWWHSKASVRTHPDLSLAQDAHIRKLSSEHYAAVGFIKIRHFSVLLRIIWW